MQEGQNLQVRDKYVIDSSKPKEQGNIWRQKKEIVTRHKQICHSRKMQRERANVWVIDRDSKNCW